MIYSGGLGETVFGMKGRGQCTETIHPSLRAWSLSATSSKTQDTGHKTDQICHLSSKEHVQAGALYHSKDWTDGKRGTRNALVLGHQDLDLTVPLKAQEPTQQPAGAPFSPESKSVHRLKGTDPRTPGPCF